MFYFSKTNVREKQNFCNGDTIVDADNDFQVNDFCILSKLDPEISKWPLRCLVKTITKMRRKS